MEHPLILGIETSCDETAAAVVTGNKRILSNLVASQVDLHRKYGGVVPELASRKHLELIIPIIKEALDRAHIGFDHLDAIAVTLGPGLIGALMIGVATAKTLSFSTNLPLIGVNHLEGHIAANFLEHPGIKPPFVALIVSGGHTSLYHCQAECEYRLLGQTLDDAVGEAYDKVAWFLGLGYPGGPIIDRLAKDGREDAVSLPRAMIRTKNYNFSLSGLKTAVINYVQSVGRKEINLPDLCASFQAAVVDVLIERVFRAAEQKQVDQILLAGGVVSNSYLRHRMNQAAKEKGFFLFFPSPVLCTDNAAMIACAAFTRFEKGEFLGIKAEPNPGLVL